MEANNGGGVAADMPEGFPSVIPGWFSEISAMWPGNFVAFSITISVHDMFVEMHQRKWSVSVLFFPIFFCFRQVRI